MLAMEKRIMTNRWPFRWKTTLIGVNATDAFFGLRYFVNPSVKFIPQMSKLAYALMHNEHLPQSPPRSPSSVGAGSSRSDSPGCGDCSGQLTRLNLFSGYSGCGQMRCIICNDLITTICADCSTDCYHLTPICAPVIKYGGERKTNCLALHQQRGPTYAPHDPKFSTRVKDEGGKGVKRPRSCGSSRPRS